ncbi:YHYH domain-containing protein [Brevibacillus borstelensis]|uniref:YHYH domain-containing protein n=1 Tax=Brevibacillus borstelensis TaxID=45462 RepID=UPI0030C4E79D
MKKGIIFLLLLVFLFSILPASFAHPGRTDANGGHTCRTNCEKWGLRYGEYHYHNGGGSSSGSASGSPKPSTPKPAAPQPAAPAPVIIPIIAVQSAVVYIQPVQHDDYVIGQLEYGAIAQDHGSLDEWITFHFADGRIGYIPKTVITQYESIQPKNITVQVDKAYVFPTPSSAGNANGSLTKNATVQALGKNGEWYYISATDNEGHPVKGFISGTVAW